MNNQENQVSTVVETFITSPIILTDEYKETIAYDDYDAVVIDEADYEKELEKSIARSERRFANEIKDIEADPARPLNGHGPEVLIGYDTETYKNEQGENIVLSMQFVLIGEYGQYKKVFYPDGPSKSDRLRLASVVQQLLIEAFEADVIIEFPEKVTICGFFLRYDLAGFSDLNEFKTRLNNIGGAVASVDKNVEVNLDFDEETLARLMRERSFIVSDRGVQRILKIRFVDVVKHTAAGTNLKQLGDLLQLPKLTIPDGYSIERMDELLRDDKVFFEAYGLRDAEIAVLYFQRAQKLAAEHMGVGYLPCTASGLAVAYFKLTLNEAELDFKANFGLEKSSIIRWNEGSRGGKPGLRTVTDIVPNTIREIHDSFIIKCYHGGRGECYIHGPTAEDNWYDMDLSSAYPMSMCDLKEIDYDGVRVSLDPFDYCGHVLGYAWVEFEFDEDTRFPTLPVMARDETMLFPLTGKSFCTAAEIEVSLNLGCKVVINHGVIFPWKSGVRIMKPFVTRLRDLRSSFPKKSIDEQYVKLVTNGLYGRTGMGLKEKKVFDLGKLKSVKLPTTDVSNPLIAAHLTGLIRAVIGEILNRIPRDKIVVSVATDGFLSNCPEDQIDLDGPLCRRFQALCDEVVPGTSMLECKHRVRQLLAIKNRCQVTLKGIKGEELVLAKGGISLLPDTREIQSAKMIELFTKRQPGDKSTIRSFTSVREQMTKDVDVVRSERSVLLNLEFDLKRHLCEPTKIVTDYGELLCFETQPWIDEDSYLKTRAVMVGWRQQHCLKTLDDWEDFKQFLQFSFARKKQRGFSGKNGINLTAEGYVGMLRHLFLRAYTQKKLGLIRSDSYPKLVKWLLDEGYNTTLSEIKNSVRQTLVEGVVIKTAETLALLNILKGKFPDAELDRLMIE